MGRKQYLFMSIDPALKRKLTILKAIEGKSLRKLVEEAIREYLRKHEDKIRGVIMLERDEEKD